MWKHIFLVIPDYLQNLEAQCVSEGYFPTEWKIAKVAVLLKSPEKVKKWSQILSGNMPASSTGESVWTNFNKSFVDFKGAFDNLERDGVLERLREVDCREVDSWSSYFENRKAMVCNKNSIIEVEVERGCPQGSIRGPQIWNLMIDTLLHELSMSYSFAAFADDLLLLIEGQSKAQLERDGAQTMALVENWGRRVWVN